MAEDRIAAAAILVEGSAEADALLATTARQLRQAGRRVCGLLMQRGAGHDCGDMVLQDIRTLDEYLVSQPMGEGSRSCRADPQGFARASTVLRVALEHAPDLVISNRFGQLEAEGQGFCAELLELLANGIPLLTAVAPRHVQAWLAFTGGAPVLPMSPEAVSAWLDRVVVPSPSH